VAVEAELLSLADVRAAADRIRPHIVKTPTISGELVAGAGVWLKAENLQRTGSFKVRGAVNAVLQLTTDQRERGVITLVETTTGSAAKDPPRVVGAGIALTATAGGRYVLALAPRSTPEPHGMIVQPVVYTVTW